MENRHPCEDGRMSRRQRLAGLVALEPRAALRRLAAISGGPDDTASPRSEPLVIPLNVAEIIERPDLHPGLLGLEDALAETGRGYQSMIARLSADWDTAIDQIIARYAHEYRSYADRFTAAVAALAAQHATITSVEVVVNHDPASTRGLRAAANPDPCVADPLVYEIWAAAHDATALPNVEVRATSEGQSG